MTAVKTIKVGRVEMPVRIYRAIAKSAERGAKLLDKNRPGWFDRVKTTKLDINSTCYCVYGQLDEREGLLAEIEEARSYAGRYPDGNSVEERFGYYIPHVSYEFARVFGDRKKGRACWRVLEEEWLRQIKQRRDAKRAAA